MFSDVCYRAKHVSATFQPAATLPEVLEVVCGDAVAVGDPSQRRCSNRG